MISILYTKALIPTEQKTIHFHRGRKTNFVLFPGQATSPHSHLQTLRQKLFLFLKRKLEDLIPTTFPFSSYFWETSSVQKWVNNFYLDRPSSLQSTSRFQGQVTTLFMCSGEEKASQSPPHCGRQIHPSIRSSLVLQGRLPPLHKGLLMPVWTLLPTTHTGMEPYSSPICELLKLAENWKSCNRNWYFSFVLLSCSLPQISFIITKVSIIMGRLCIWEIDGLCHIQIISWLTNGKKENILLPSLGLYSSTPFSIYCTSELL